MSALWVVVAYLMGLMFGSFANVVIYRVPRGLSIVKPPSGCPDCGHRLGVLDLVPVVSRFLLRGKCRYCKARLSFRYSAVEFVCGLLFAGMAAYTTSFSAVPLSMFAFVLLCVTVIDWDTQEIPDGLVIFGAVTGVAWVAAAHFLPQWLPGAVSWQNGLVGMAVGALPLFLLDRVSLLLLKKDGFGYGDVKLMAVVGLFLGWQLVLTAFFIAFMVGAVYAVWLMASGRAKRGTYMPFGPFLCVGALGALWGGEFILEWVVGLFAVV